MKTPTARIETITPAIAMELLTLNTTNRPISHRVVNDYAQQMSDGIWRFNGDAIRLNGTRLIDGQHRLHAIVKAGVTVQTVVVRGLEDDAFDSIDIGKRRSGADVMSIAGEPYSAVLAGALQWVWRYGLRCTDSGKAMPVTELRGFLDAHPGIRNSVSLCVHQAKTKLLSQGQLSAYHYLFSQVSPMGADEFVIDLATGINLRADDPVYLLRERLLNVSLKNFNQTTNAQRLSRTGSCALLIKAFNARHLKRPLQVLRWGGSERFPEIVGLLPAEIAISVLR